MAQQTKATRKTITVGAASRRIIDTGQSALYDRLRKQGHLGLRITLQVRIPEARGYSPVEGMTIPLQVESWEGLRRVKAALRDAVTGLRATSEPAKEGD